MIIVTPYTKYTKKQVLSTAIDIREDNMDKKDKKTPSAFSLFFSFGYYRFSIIYKPRYLSRNVHLEFRALSEGFEKFTSSGYKSIFLEALPGERYSRREIKDIMIKALIREGDLDLASPDKKTLQRALF